MTNIHWPILKSYDGERLTRVAMPLGGIGTGTVSLGGRGDLRDWEVVNRPAKGFTPGIITGVIDEVGPFFALWAKAAGGQAVARCLEGPLPVQAYEGAHGVCTAAHHGLPRFRSARFDAAYPLAQITLEDSEVPVGVLLEAWNPLVPGDADASGWPVAVLRWVLKNRSAVPVETSICGVLPNFVGADGSSDYCDSLRGNVNEFRREGRLQGLFLHSTDTDTSREQWGSLALAVLDQPEDAITHRLDWTKGKWSAGMLDFWDDFLADGRLEPRPIVVPDPAATLGALCTLAPGESRSVTFVLAWHFPNRKSWTPVTVQENGAAPEAAGEPVGAKHDENHVGNYYTQRHSDAWETACAFSTQIEPLETQTVHFVRAFCDSDLPLEIREAALFNLSTLRSQTVFRIADGSLFGWEGCHDRSGSCHGSCTHVWNYETAVASLFGELSRSMRNVEFLHATRDNGLMCFRVNLPLQRARDFGWAAADGQMGTLMRLHRDWVLCGDDDWLRRLWPKAKNTLEFCWVAGGWDADCDGVMEGCQHNTMDVEYFGPNPQMQFWYLGALRACEEMAKAMDDLPFSGHCRELYNKGSAWMDAHLFNGEYYEHEIRPVVYAEALATGTRMEGMGAPDLGDPAFQLGAGCLIDQLVGQYMAHVCGLGYLAEPGHVQRTLQSIMRYNWRDSLHNHFNNMRTYALGDESALLMASYPRGNRPAQPFPYYNEVMTGFEYTAAAGMLYEGQTEAGLRTIRSIRSRYDGRKRNPFDEAECGHHYARAMASWTALLASTGFSWDARSCAMEFNRSAEAAQWFWSNGSAWGTVEQQPDATQTKVLVTVLSGSLKLSTIRFKDFGAASWETPQQLTAGQNACISVTS